MSNNNDDMNNKKNTQENNENDNRKDLAQNNEKDYIDITDDKKKSGKFIDKLKKLPWKDINKKTKEGVKKLPWREIGDYVYDKKNKKPRIINIRRFFRFLKTLLKVLLVLAIIFGLIIGIGAYVEKKENDKIIEAIKRNIPVDTDYNFEEEYKEALSEPSDIEGMTFKDKYDMGLLLAIGSDTDGDDLTDKEEIEIYKTNPLLFSTSGDMYGDGYKVKYNMDLTKKYDGEFVFIDEIPLNISLEGKTAEDSMCVVDDIEYKIDGVPTVKSYEIYGLSGFATIDFSEYIQANKEYVVFTCVNDGEINDITSELKNNKVKLKCNNNYIIIGLIEKVDSTSLSTIGNSLSSTYVEKMLEGYEGRHETMIVMFPILSMLFDKEAVIFETKSIFNTAQTDEAYAKRVSEQLSKAMEMDIKVKHTYVNAGAVKCLKAILDKTIGMINNIANIGEFSNLFIAYQYVEDGDLVGYLTDEYNDDEDKKPEAETAKQPSPYVTTFDLSKDTFLFPNFRSYQSEGGNCMGISIITAKLFNDNLYERKDDLIYKGMPFSYDLTSSSSYDTLFDRYLYDYKYDNYFNDNYGEFGMIDENNLTEEDKAFIDFVGAYHQYGNKQTTLDVSYFGDFSYDKIEALKQQFAKNKIGIIIYNLAGEYNHAFNVFGWEQSSNNPNISYIYIYDNNFPNSEFIGYDYSTSTVVGTVKIDSRIEITKKKRLHLFRDATYVFYSDYYPFEQYNVGDHYGKHMPFKRMSLQFYDENMKVLELSK